MKKTLYLITLLIPAFLYAQDEQATVAADDEVLLDPVALFEEITVVGEKTFFTIRHQITRAEDDLYSLFNDLNSSDEFDIICREFRINSHIPQRLCEPLFLTRKRRANTIMSMAEMRSGTGDGIDLVAMQRGFDLLETETELKSEAEPDFDALNEEIFRIASENPQYLEALMRVGKLKTILAEEREKKFGKSE